MRSHDEQTPQASPFFGVRQFNARANSSANRFLPTPSSPVNSKAPGRRPEVIIRFNASLTPALPVSSLNIYLVTSAAQKRNDQFSYSLLCLFYWTSGIYYFYAFGFGRGDLQIGVAYARVKLRVFDVESIAPAFYRGILSG